MVEERVVKIEHPGGSADTHTTIYEDRPRSGRGGAGWFIAIVVALALAAALYFIANMSNSRATRDNAIAGAASDVGAAARKIGNAAETAIDKPSDK